MEPTKGRASAANMRMGGRVETDEEAKKRAERETAEQNTAAQIARNRYKNGGASPTFRLKVPPQADDEIPVVLKPKSERRVNTNKPSEPF